MTATSKWGFCIIAALTFTFLFSCQKMLVDESGTAPNVAVDLSSKVSSTVSGFVTDENDVAVRAATVKVGAQNVTTDKYGFFQVRNEQVIKNAATVTVSMPGYFPGIRTIMAEQNGASFVRIKLIPKTTSGSFNAAAGGSVTLLNGLKIILPAGAVVNAATGAAYTGAVNVAASWIDPTAADCDRIMPGDLRALDLQGALKQLTTFGMAAVELSGTAGEKLQVAPGKKATVSFPLPSSLASAAPASIPLWYFDESIGLWKEEGNAIKTGNSYEGEVSHFSFWNCDVPADFVQVTMIVKDNAGNPVPFAYVKISRVANPGSSATGYTDSTGRVHGAIPANAQLKLEIFTSNSCGSPVHTQTFTSTTTNVNLGIITINATQGAAVLSGTATTCNNTPIVNGFVIMKKGSQFYRYNLGAGGTFQFTTLLCNNTAMTVDLIAEDVSAGQQGAPITRNIIVGNNAIGNLQACGITTQQFVNMTVNGVAHNYSAPVDSLTLRFEQNNTSSINYYLSASRLGTIAQYTYIAWNAQGIAAGTTQPLIRFDTQAINDSTVMVNPININITEHGTTGQFVAGNFTGSFRGAPPTNTVYNVTCTFRVRRYF